MPWNFICARRSDQHTTHSELAFEVDFAREVISRCLKTIEERGYVKLERGRIIILVDLDKYNILNLIRTFMMKF